VKIVPDMTYNVFGGTLNLAQSINLPPIQNPRYAPASVPVRLDISPHFVDSRIF